jgi:hypothetical protein
MPVVKDFHALNACLVECCDRDSHERIRWGKTVHDLWLEEKEKLRPLPEKMPEACVSTTAKVNRRQMARFASNWYSVPPQHVGKTVTVKAFVFQVIIALAETVIALHARSYERDEEMLDPHHYLPVLLRKPGAFERATPIVAWPLPPVYDTYRRRLKERHEGSQGIREYIRILMLLKDHPEEEVTAAVEKALSYGISSADGVINLLSQVDQPATEIVSLRVNSPPVLPNRVDQFDLLLRA